MAQTLRDRYSDGYEDRSFAETPFLEVLPYAGEIELQELLAREQPGGAWQSWEMQTPFLPTAAAEAGEAGSPSADIATLGEIAAELKDSEFREALEALADEALDMHRDQLAGQYGDPETRGLAAERLLNDHFAPLAAQADTALERFVDRLEGYEASALNEMEIDRIASEVMPSDQPLTPAAEQFLGKLLSKAGKWVSAAVKVPLKLAGEGLALAGKLAFGPFIGLLKKLARFLLGHVVKFALDRLPVQLRPLAQKLSDHLFHQLGETHQDESGQYEQLEAEAIPAAPDVARLEAEYDLHAAQLLLVPDEAEIDHLVSSYGESAQETYEESPLQALDRARGELADGLLRLQPGESPQPVMEQFLPVLSAIMPALKAVVSAIGRPRVMKFISGLLANLIKPILGSEAANMLAPEMASTGLGLVGLETGPSDPRATVAEALAATIEDTATRLGELPPHVFEHDTLLDAAVREAFEEAAAAYFPDALIKPELRETADEPGVWQRMPQGSQRKRYARYSRTPEVMVTPRMAGAVETFGGGTLRDHLRERMDLPPERTFKGRVKLYQVMPGGSIGAIARAEGIRKTDLHPLTPHAAGVLLGANAGLGERRVGAPPHPHRLHLRQRLYSIEPAEGRRHLHHRHHHAHRPRTELMLNLRKGEIRVWLYLSEHLCQQIATELGKGRDATPAFRLVEPLVRRARAMLTTAVAARCLPPELRVVTDTPDFDGRVPSWLAAVGRHLAAKIEEWTSHQIAQYFANNADAIRHLSTEHRDGLTLRLTMSIPGIETLRLIAQGRRPPGVDGRAWLNGTPSFAIAANPGYAIK
jgi:hypothetical protein